MRAEKELQDWFDSLSEAEKEAERQGRSYQYATETDEIYFDISTFQILMQKTMTCPSNNMRINKKMQNRRSNLTADKKSKNLHTLL